MPSAVVLINCTVGRESSVVEEVCRMEGVEKAFLVYGVFDVVAIVSSTTMEGLETILMNRVRPLLGVDRTMTLMISRDCSGQ
jgi:DNA-binding Lrp family transcriptional regulator